MRTPSDLPTPPGRLPLIGHLLQLEVGRLHHIFEDWATELGTFRLQMGPRSAVVLSDPADLTQVLRERPGTFRRQKHLAETIEELQVHGVFTAEGKAWTKQRKLAMRALGQQNLKSFFPLLERVTRDLLERWQRADGQNVDVLADTVCFTVDVTTELAFSEKAGSLSGERSSLLQNIDPIFPALGRRLFAVLPTWRLLKLAGDRELDRAVAEVRLYVARLIDEARERRTEGAPTDFLQAMLDEADGEGAFDEEALFGNAMTMLFAGEDTTANTLAWALHLLADHPAVVERLRAEIDPLLGDDAVPQNLEATKSPYLDAVIHEVMRLKPVGPMLFMEPIETAMVGDLQVEPGTTLVLLSRVGALQPGRLPGPEDLWVFDPDRFADPKLAGRLQREGVFVPFGSGPRICPGRALALLELRMALCMVVKTFDLVRDGASSDVVEVNGFTMSPQGLSLRFLPRAG